MAVFTVTKGGREVATLIWMHNEKNFSVPSIYGVNFKLLEGWNYIENSTGVLFIDRGIDF